MCAPATPETLPAEVTEAPPVVTEAPPVVTEAPPVVTEAPPEVTEVPTEIVTEAPAEEITLAIIHFSVIEGTTWSGAQDRAAKRIVEKYPNVKYIYRENITPDQVVPSAEEMIAEGGNIVVGNAEHVGMPLLDITDKYPDVDFMAVVASDVTQKPNFIRYFPRQYQALYLEGLIAGALTQTGNIGIVSAFPNIQVIRRTAGFYLGVQDAAKLLNKDVNVYVKYVGGWFMPPEEGDIAATLIDQYDVDVITQQTDSGSPLDVATEKGIWYVGKDMDIVGEYGWSTTDTVAVSFDTRWEGLFDKVIQARMAGEDPETLLFLGMDQTMELADGTVEAAVDIMNDGKVGVEAISPKALPLIPQEIVDLVKQRREQMMAGEWDPFTEHAFVSNGTGLELDGLPIPAAGTEVKPAGEVPTDEWLLSKFNFDLEGMQILE
jgi:basic membrane lipoprotein Med (substrate-binding protein (PBP1-ABC) superfamily)